MQPKGIPDERIGTGWLKCGTLGMRQVSRWGNPSRTLKPTHAAPPASLDGQI